MIMSIGIYIYIYIERERERDMCVCVCVGGLCVLWVTGGITSGIFEAAPQCLEDLSLSILVRRPRKVLRPRKPAGP